MSRIIIVKFNVTKEGEVEKPVIVEAVPPGYFENAVLNALEKYKFKPAMEYGLPVDYEIEWPFFFKFSNTSLSDDNENRMQAFRYATTGKRFIDKAEYQKAVKEISNSH